MFIPTLTFFNSMQALYLNSSITNNMKIRNDKPMNVYTISMEQKQPSKVFRYNYTHL